MRNMDKYLSLLDGEIDGLLLTSRYSRHYCAEYDIAEGMAIVTKSGCRYYTDSRYIEAAQKGIQGFVVIDVGGARDYAKLVNEAISDFGITALGYEEAYLSAAEYFALSEKLHAKLVPANDRIHGFRAVKEPWEQERMRKAQEIADHAFLDVLPRLKVGMTELEAQAELIYCMYKNGAHGLSFDPIVVSGPNTSKPHGVAGDRAIQNGDFLTMDFGVLYQGYCSDTTRTVAFGSVTEKMRQVYETVRKAQETAIAATKAGLPGKVIDGAARGVITDAGYGEYFGHGYGHSLGLEIHESPNMNARTDALIPAGAVCSAEPGIYLPGEFGVRIEDVVIVREDGCENLTKLPKELIIL